MKIQCALVLAVLVSSEAFAPAPKPFRASTSLHFDLSEVSPTVFVAVGIALVGGIGAATISSKLRDGEGGGDDDAHAAPAPAASAPVASTPATAPVADDISIPYDAPAKLAYEKAGSSGDYAAFKTKFEADAVAESIAKKNARETA
mmetsp:Transcript_29616/g.48871  ORF Transcript_29616/g.48871 Transcript_29616/m.48871 type:complete len:146 (+) Transcript_29616:76-513(+)|eukprot:CAMPEP_0119002940 /NCGR_PEP_ID=MMETSP1176-20130426/251_1 /TAXON_ID=265551 /ORGANISM="Synedropsis recta cf, Strain CCMP1620" /LENGTH=145 /DNA_ID=CAMNT_0006954485 /DNA_START=56 /DNA_END=493 /DNA_ORIENTATION=+